MIKLSNLLDDKKRQDIIWKAITVLSEIGIGCNHPETIKKLSERTKITYSGGRIKFDPKLITDYLERKKELRKEEYDTEFKMLGPMCSFEICDPSTNEVRTASETDVINSAKLIDSITEGSGPFGGCIPLYADGVAARLSTLNAERIAVTYTRKLGGILTAIDKTEIDFISEMYKASGRRYKLALQGLISPLRLNPEILDTFYAQDENSDIDLDISCAIPMAGATAPVVFPAALIQCTAEAIAVDFIFNTLSNRNFDVLRVRLEPFDMKSNNIVFGSPEWCILNKAVVDLEGDLMGTPRRYGIFRSNSKRVDAQSMCERSMVVMFQALNGIRKFGAVGQLCVDEVFSPLQAVLDVEILKYVKRVLGDFNGSWDEDADYLEILRDGIAEETFLGLDSTVDNFRKFYSYDNLFRYENLNTWRHEGMKGLEDYAREEMGRIIKSHDFCLEDNAKQEIDRIYKEGAAYLLKKSG